MLKIKELIEDSLLGGFTFKDIKEHIKELDLGLKVKQINGSSEDDKIEITLGTGLYDREGKEVLFLATAKSTESEDGEVIGERWIEEWEDEETEEWDEELEEYKTIRVDNGYFEDIYEQIKSYEINKIKQIKG